MPKTGIRKLNRKPIEYISPKDDDEVERWAVGFFKGESIALQRREQWLNERIKGGQNGNTNH